MAKKQPLYPHVNTNPPGRMPATYEEVAGKAREEREAKENRKKVEVARRLLVSAQELLRKAEVFDRQVSSEVASAYPGEAVGYSAFAGVGATAVGVRQSVNQLQNMINMYSKK